MESIIENSSIKFENIQVRVTLMANSEIERWDCNWHVRENGLIDIRFFIIFKGCVLHGHDHVMEVMEIDDEHVDVMIYLPPIENSMDAKDYIIIIFL